MEDFNELRKWLLFLNNNYYTTNNTLVFLIFRLLLCFMLKFPPTRPLFAVFLLILSLSLKFL